MESFHIRLKDDRYREFLMDLLSRLEFIEFSSPELTDATEKQGQEKYNIFDSAGIWSDYDVTGETLRQSGQHGIDNALRHQLS